MEHSGRLHIVLVIGSDDPAARTYRVGYAAPTLGVQAATNRRCVGDRELRDVLTAMGVASDQVQKVVAADGCSAAPVTITDVPLTTERLRELGFPLL